MKRVSLLVTVALMLAVAMALSGVAQAQPIGGSADAQCAKLAIQTLGPSYNPSNYTFIGGTEGNDNFAGQATDGPDVFCGFGGNDVTRTLDEGDIFLGGAGPDWVYEDNSGTFYGEEGNDEVAGTNFGTFYGGEGVDFVLYDNSGTFYGEEGNDIALTNSGTFYGGAGNDLVYYDNTGTFYGEEGNDDVWGVNYGTFVQ